MRGMTFLRNWSSFLKANAWFTAALSAALCSQQAYPQISQIGLQASNRLEYRLSWPEKNESFRNWLDADYYFGGVITGFRLQMTQPSDGVDVSQKIVQRYVEYSHSNLRLRVGNFYKRLGRGLIFHAFELQKISLNRFEQNFIVDRNVDGVLLDWQSQRISATLFSGSPKWRPAKETLRAAAFTVRPRIWLSMGMNYLRSNNPSAQLYGEVKREFLSFSSEFTADWGSLYSEYAWQQGKEKRRRAVYLASNVFLGPVGLSAEWKDYKQFFTGYNNPPTLVKEHSFTLLNRHSHQVNLLDEIGMQLEATASLGPQTSLVVNYSRAENHKHEFSSLFEEKYLELSKNWNETVALRGAVDASRDRPVGEESRRTAVLEGDYYFPSRRSITVLIQAQKLRNFYAHTEISNWLVMIGGNEPGRVSVYLQWEHSTSPLEKRSDWYQLNLNIKIGGTHDLFFTVGQRRAGLACASGQCRYVPEFRGVEFRLNSRF